MFLSRLPERLGAAALAVAVLGTHDAAAQAVRVRAVESGNRPVAGALVSVRDGDATLVRALTDDGGRALLALPRAGRFEIRADRIGYAGIAGIPFEVQGTDTASVVLEMPGDRVLLPEVSVVGRSAVCRMDREERSELMAIWAEVAKALQGTELTRTGLAPLLEITRFERDLNPELQVRTERSSSQQIRSARAFVSVEPAQLVKDGFVVKQDATTWFYGPDAVVLLSDEFLETHCFRAVPGPTPGDGLVGLAFEPTRNRRVPEVTGTLWLHRETSELRSLEFQFVNFKGRTGHEGGRVEFTRLASGGWIVSDWVIRVPILVETRGRTTLESDPVVGFRETGGAAQLVDLAPANRAVVMGVVYDSILGRPLEGVEVSLGGSAYRATTDSAGVYRIETPTQGTFLVAAAHPRFAALGIEPRGSATLARGRTATADIATPSSATLWRGCVATAVDSTAPTVLGGIVRDSTGQPIPGARLDLSWGPAAARRLVARADGQGRYRVCGLPADTDVWFRAAPEQVPSPHWATIGSGAVVVHDVTLRSPAAVRGDGAVQIAVQADSTPVSDALVRLYPRGDTVRTDQRGRARLDEVPAGRYLVDVRALGYQIAAVPVDVGERGSADVSVGLTRVAQQLEGLDVVAGPSVRSSSRMAGLETRRRTGLGRFVMREELTRRAESQLVDVLRRIPGLAVVELPFPCPKLVPASTRRGVAQARLPCQPEGDSPIRSCLMAIYVDGMPYWRRGDGNPRSVDEFHIQTIEAVEVYVSEAGLPPEFAGIGTECGVLALWMR